MAKKILITEDNNFLQKMVAVSLEEEGFEVLKASDGKQTVEILKKEKPDLLLLDIMMPKLDGFGVLEYLKQKKSTIPVIVISNLGQQEDVKKCKELGAKDYIIKSDMDSEDLVAQVKKYV